MSHKPINSKIQMNKKNPKEFVRVLRHLSQSDNLKNNKIKITISQDEIIEEKNKVYFAPSIFKNTEYSTNHNSTKKSSVNKIENSNIEKNLSPHNAETEDYPDSSDFSDDE